ncbi:hypothetical protein GCM10027422_37520 [Hymenobacter arcticus]
MKLSLLPGLLCFAQLLVACQSKPTEQTSLPSADGMYVSPTGQSDERAYKLLPEKGSEDASHLLHNLPAGSQPAASDSAKEYVANPRYDWIVQVRPARPVRRQEVLAQFGAQWQKQYEHPDLYGRSTRSSRWTYLAAADADSVYSEIALGWKLYNERVEAPRPFTAAEFSTYQQAVAQQAALLPGRITNVNYPPAQAAAASQQLAGFVAANNLEARIVLKADKPFEGTEIWDKLRSLGLHWGDMDLFHWENPASDAGGDDHLFSVSTSTEPGYFLPEHLAKGEVKTADLIFSFSIPRSSDPPQVLENMHRAASYCQQKLGGQLLDENGQPFELATELKKCQWVTQNLAGKKLRPGHGDALYLF